MTSSGAGLLHQVSFGFSLVNLANALDTHAPEPNIKAGKEMQELLTRLESELEETAAA